MEYRTDTDQLDPPSVGELREALEAFQADIVETYGAPLARLGQIVLRILDSDGPAPDQAPAWLPGWSSPGHKAPRLMSRRNRETGE